MASLVWRVMRPSLEQQSAFNSPARRSSESPRRPRPERRSRPSRPTIAALRSQLSDLMAFESRLIGYLQQVTAYVDTKDREVAGRALVVNAAVNGVADDLAKRWESMVAREQRFDAKVAALTAAHAGDPNAGRHLAAGLARNQARAGTAGRGDDRRNRRTCPHRRRPARARSAGISTRTSTSASKISFADRKTRSVDGWRATFPISMGQPTCSTSAAGAASSSIC